MAKRLFLLDGMALAYRAYFSMIRTPLINSKGMNTSAVFGFVNTLNKLIDDEKPDFDRWTFFSIPNVLCP